MWSQPHVKLALQHDFTVTQSCHEMHPSGARTESFLLLGERHPVFTPRSLLIQSCPCRRKRTGLCSLGLYWKTSPSTDRFYSQATRFALLRFLFPPRRKDGMDCPRQTCHGCCLELMLWEKQPVCLPLRSGSKHAQDWRIFHFRL